MEVRIRRASKHHQRSRVAHDRWQAGGFGVERPDDHPVRTDRDGRAGPIKRIGVAVLQSPIEHVDQSGLGIRRFGLPCHDVQHPPHPHGTRAHICLSDDVFVARDTYPLVRTWTQHGHRALSIHFRNGGLARDAVRPRQERSSNLGFQYFIGDVGHRSSPVIVPSPPCDCRAASDALVSASGQCQWPGQVRPRRPGEGWPAGLAMKDNRGQAGARATGRWPGRREGLGRAGCAS